jgi:hypothetical protein
MEINKTATFLNLSRFAKNNLQTYPQQLRAELIRVASVGISHPLDHSVLRSIVKECADHSFGIEFPILRSLNSDAGTLKRTKNLSEIAQIMSDRIYFVKIGKLNISTIEGISKFG